MAQTVTPTQEANTVINFASGTFTGDGGIATVGWTQIGAVSGQGGGSAVVNTGLGFVPRYVYFMNATDRIGYEWFQGMASGTTLKTVAAGTRTLDTGDAAIATSGSTLSFSAAACINAKVIYWMAMA